MQYQIHFAILFVSGLLWTLYRVWQYKRDSKYADGPTPWPLVGNIWTIYRLHTDTERVLGELGRKYGDICMLWIGLWPAIVINSAEAAHDILHKV